MSGAFLLIYRLCRTQNCQPLDPIADWPRALFDLLFDCRNMTCYRVATSSPPRGQCLGLIVYLHLALYLQQIILPKAIHSKGKRFRSVCVRPRYVIHDFGVFVRFFTYYSMVYVTGVCV